MLKFKNKIRIMSFVTSTLLLVPNLSAKSINHKSYDSKSATYYNQCVGCHGYKAEKSAFDRARPLRTLSKEDLYNKISYYKNTPNKKLTTEMLMNKQIKDVSEEEIKKVVTFILSLPETQKRGSSLVLKDNKVEIH